MPAFYDHNLYRVASKRLKRTAISNMARQTWETGEGELEPRVEEMDGLEASQRCLVTDSLKLVQTSDRRELIERIKRGESPRWLPNQAIEAFLAGQEEVNQGRPPSDPLRLDSVSAVVSTAFVPGNASQRADHRQPSNSPDSTELHRPALHAGDFRSTTMHQESLRKRVSLDRSLTDPRRLAPEDSPASLWGAPSPVPLLPRFHTDSQTLNLYSKSIEHVTRARGSSMGSSHSSSFIMRAPTSPLVYSANNADLDFSQRDDLDAMSLSKSNRRRTLPPETFRALQSSLDEDYQPITNFSRPFPNQAQQAQQPRRSLTSFTYQPALSPKTPSMSRSRKHSLSDISPIQHAAMVGSFEESILRGRMSTAPSKPLDFVAQIGVLGKGDCKTHLRCPSHVTVPFPAVFYSYPSVSSSRSFSDDSPSPYVGTIDLEHSLKPIEAPKQRKGRTDPNLDLDHHMRNLTAPENTPIGRDLERKQRQKRRRSLSPKGPVGGCYRVPQQGQLQIVIKNPNKTAVKLYLVPYDLEGMEPGTKTFIRQRSFSAGPIIEKALTDKPESALPADPLKDKHMLRYLIHLKFCCPTKGRFYLYDNIRVVFANRVPDGKEKLQNEIQLPEPRYSTYKPGRDSSMGSAGAKLTAEKALRRRSSGFGHTPGGLDTMDGVSFGGASRTDVRPPLPLHPPAHFPANPKPLTNLVQTDFVQGGMVPNLPHTVPRQSTFFGDVNSDSIPERKHTLSPTPGFNPSTSARGSPVPWGSSSASSSGRSFSPAPFETGESLLAQKLRGLDVQRPRDEPQE